MRPAWIRSLPRAYWKSLEESEQPALGSTSAPAPETPESRALDHYYAFQQRQSSLMARATVHPSALPGLRNANLQDANRRYTTLYDRRQNDRRNITPAASGEFNTNRRRTRERRAAPAHFSLSRHAGLRDSSLPEETIPLPYTAPLMLDETVEPIRIDGLAYPVLITGQMMQIGTATLTLAEWSSISDNVILDNYGRNLLNFWRSHREMLLNMARERVTT